MKLTTKELKYTSDDIIIDSDVLLDLSIDEGNFYLQMYDEDGTFVSVPLSASVVSGSQNVCTVKTPTLQNNKIYILTGFSIISADRSEMITKQIFRFLSIDKPTIFNTNNVYTQLKDISEVLSVEYLLKNQEEYTLEFKPSTYNFDSKTYEYSNEVVTIQNNKKMLDLLVGQYFTEYKPFYDAINSGLSKTKYEASYINNIHLQFMNNIAKWYSLKGNKSFIEIMTNIYAKYLGYNVLSIVEDPKHNFIYRVSSSIPKIEWNKNIKPFVHPMGWNDIYNEVTSIINGFYIQPTNFGSYSTSGGVTTFKDRKPLMMNSTWALDCMSYLDAEAYSKQMVPHYRRIKNLYHFAGNIESFSVTAHENNKPVSLQQVHDEYKFGMNLNVHTGKVEYLNNTYATSGLYKELKDKKNIKYHIDRFNKTLTVDFGMPGVANEYFYKHFVENEISYITESLLSKLKIDFNSKDILVLKLKKGDWEQDVNRVDGIAFEYKCLPYIFSVNNARDKFLNIRNDNKKAYQYNGLAVGNFSSEATVNTLAYTNDYEHTYAISASSVSASFIAEFDTVSSFVVSGSTFDVNGTNYKKTTFKYNKAGFYKYVWKLYSSGKLIQETATYFNNVSFNIPDSEYLLSDVELTIFYKNGFHTLKNKAVCV